MKKIQRNNQSISDKIQRNRRYGGPSLVHHGHRKGIKIYDYDMNLRKLNLRSEVVILTKKIWRVEGK